MEETSERLPLILRSDFFCGRVLQDEGTFFYLPFLSLYKITEYFRRTVVRFFTDKKLLTGHFARNLLSWRHSGFSNECFKENVHMFEACDFLAELTQRIPPKGVQLIRRCGLYSSQIKGAWESMPHVAERALSGWKSQHESQAEQQAKLTTRLAKQGRPSPDLDPDLLGRCVYNAPRIAHVFQLEP